MGGKNFMIDRKDKRIFFTKGQSYKTYKNNVILQWKASTFVTNAKSYYIKVIFSVILQFFFSLIGLTPGVNFTKQVAQIAKVQGFGALQKVSYSVSPTYVY